MSHQLDEKAIFDVARRIESEESRQQYLRHVCGDDHALLERLVALMHVHDQPGSFLESPLVDAAATIEQSGSVEQVGTMIGPYQLLEQIGEGGMGVVYLATQQEPVRRQVALKVIKPGMDSKQVVSRFEADRQALALMDHPSIARVFDAGATESGRPYFVMELVKRVST